MPYAAMSAPAASSRSTASSEISAVPVGFHSRCSFRFGTSHADSSGCCQHLVAPIARNGGNVPRTRQGAASILVFLSGFAAELDANITREGQD
jgi:hypothetical protein